VGSNIHYIFLCVAEHKNKLNTPMSVEVKIMAKEKKPTKTIQHKYTADDLVAILDTVIPIYEDTNIISFHTILARHCTYKQTHWEYWLRDRSVIDERITERFNVLRALQEQKIINGAMTGDYNPAFSMFFLKCKRGWLEEQHAAKIVLDEKRLAMDSKLTEHIIDTEININMGSEEDE